MKKEKYNYLNVYNKFYGFWENRKQAKEREKLGFCNRDVWEIYTWFFTHYAKNA